MVQSPELEPAFPEQFLRPTLAQAASWTTIEAIVSAARMIEGRTDRTTPYFILAFPDNELLELLLLRVLAYVIQDYRCSREKLVLARHLDAAIQPSTMEILAEARLNPQIQAGGPAAALEAMPQLAGRGPMRIFKVIDTPPMLELIFEPFQMLRSAIVSLFTEAAQLRVLERKMLRDTSDSQETIVTQRPYADGPLIATLDALVYFALGFKVKIEWGTDHQSIEVAFRCVNIVGPPPLSAMHFDAARTAFDSLVQDLTRA